MSEIVNFFSLKGKVALVTGSRRGIGKGIALVLAKAGADVVITDYTSENGDLEAAVEEIKKLGRRSAGFVMDVSSEPQVNDTVKKVISAFGKIDILVNNAGIANPDAPAPQITVNDWNQIFAVNLNGCLICSKAVIPYMVEKRQGSIINIASVEGLKVLDLRRSSCAYAASKAAIIMLTRGLAWDLGKHNVRANVIAPGAVRTEMVRYIWDPASLPKEMLPLLQQFLAERGVKAAIDDIPREMNNYIKTTVPLGRFAEPEEIGYAVNYLASDAASYVTGQTLIVDGGLLA